MTFSIIVLPDGFTSPQKVQKRVAKRLTIENLPYQKSEED